MRLKSNVLTSFYTNDNGVARSRVGFCSWHNGEANDDDSEAHGRHRGVKGKPTKGKKKKINMGVLGFEEK